MVSVEDITSVSGSVLVTANPGTGKTHLLAEKYAFLIKSKVDPKDIVCLTFTNKAKCEMEDRIIKALNNQGLTLDLSKLNVYTFHSYALEYLDEGKIISTNLLRFIIYEFLKEKEVLNYEDERLITDVVPRLENLMRYLKSYGITPDQIDKKKVKFLLEDFERTNDVIEKQDLEKFLDYFLEIFELYEKEKSKKGIDYADLLINFLRMKKKPFYKHVLVDELQDVNNLEAKIALESGENFFAVGDKKQAIFGFQGGSIENFKLFKNKKPQEFNLIENRRSTQQILDFASKDYTKKSMDEESKKELIGLKSYNNKNGPKTQIIESTKETTIGTICTLINQLKDKQVAIIVRTNTQIAEIAKELETRGIEFSATHIASSIEAKQNIITFIKAIFSTDVDDIKNALFTPFFPISLEEAFGITKIKDLTLEQILEKCPEFKQIREQQKDIETINQLFEEIIYPVSIAYGEEYLLAAQTMQESTKEALTLIDDKTLNNLILYLEACDLEASTAKKEAKLTLTTVHKAKGLGYDNVIYLPKKTREKGGFYDYVIEKILESKGMLETSELEEETLRIDFVAYTRTKEQLFIITDKPTEYLNEETTKTIIEPENTSQTYQEKQKKAYTLFLNKKYDEAKILLETDHSWLLAFIKNHFDTLEHISFSRLTTDAHEYFTKNILGLRESTYATNLGSNIHKQIEKYLNGEKINPTKEEQPYIDNAIETINTIKNEYSEFVEAEHEIKIPLKNIIETTDEIQFKGVIDAVFKKGENYLIVDWKTSKTTNSASEYRRQLELYKRAYANKKGIKTEQIQVSIAFIGIRKIINDQNIYKELDENQPRKNVYETIQKHFNKFTQWKTHPEQFLEELNQTKNNTPLTRAIKEQTKKE